MTSKGSAVWRLSFVISILVAFAIAGDESSANRSYGRQWVGRESERQNPARSTIHGDAARVLEGKPVRRRPAAVLTTRQAKQPFRSVVSVLVSEGDPDLLVEDGPQIQQLIGISTLVGTVEGIILSKDSASTPPPLNFPVDSTASPTAAPSRSIPTTAPSRTRKRRRRQKRRRQVTTTAATPNSRDSRPGGKRSNGKRSSSSSSSTLVRNIDSASSRSSSSSGKRGKRSSSSSSSVRRVVIQRIRRQGNDLQAVLDQPNIFAL